jgi:hypothetical protein
MFGGLRSLKHYIFPCFSSHVPSPDFSQIYNCSIHHDPKAKVYRLKDDKTLAAAYRTYELSIDSWKKLDDDLVQMCCRGGESQDLATVIRFMTI